MNSEPLKEFGILFQEVLPSKNHLNFIIFYYM